MFETDQQRLAAPRHPGPKRFSANFEPGYLKNCGMDPDPGCRCTGVIEDTGACNASSSYSAFRPEAGGD